MSAINTLLLQAFDLHLIPKKYRQEMTDAVGISHFLARANGLRPALKVKLKHYCMNDSLCFGLI